MTLLQGMIMSTTELKELFKRYGVSHAEIAKRLGCSYSNVAALLNDYRTLNSHHLAQLQVFRDEVLSHRAVSLMDDINQYAPHLAGKLGINKRKLECEGNQNIG